MKYEGELKHELRRFIVPLCIREFPVLVEQAKAVEQLERGPTVELDHRRPLQTLVNRGSHIPDHHLLPRNYSVLTVVVSI